MLRTLVVRGWGEEGGDWGAVVGGGGEWGNIGNPSQELAFKWCF